MSRLLPFLKKHRAPLLAFFAASALLTVAYAIFGIFPFGKHSVLVLDLAGQYVYFFEALWEAIRGDGSLLYSLARPLGGEFLGILAYYLASPFSLLVLLFPKENITAAVWLILFLKTGAAATTAAIYLKRLARRLPTALTVALSVAYALSGFAVAYQSNTMWADAWILLPLVMLGLERLMDRKGFLLYTVTLTLTFITNYYMGYMIAGFCVLYFLYYLIASPHISKHKIIHNATFFILFSALSALIAAFMLFPAAYSLTLGKSGFTIPTAREFLLVGLPGLLKKLLPATYDTVMNDGTPFLYCGIFAVLLLPFYFLTRSVSKRQRIADGVLLAVLLLSMVIEPLDRIWHGFSAPNGLPCRFAFLFIFLLLRLAAITLHAPRKREKKQLLTPLSVSFGVLLAATILLWVFDPALHASAAFLPITLTALTLTAVALFFVLLYSQKAKLLCGLLALVIVCEIGCNAVYTLHALHEDVTFMGQAVFEEQSNALLAANKRLQSADGGFYRTETTDHLKSNDNMYSGMRGLSGSSSTLHGASISFLASIGIPARWHRSLYNSANPLTDALLGVKYVISEKDIPFFTPVFTENGLTAFQNGQALSMAYGVQDTEFTATNNAAVNCNRWLSAMTGGEVQAFLPLADHKTLIGGCTPYLSEEDVLVYMPKSADSVAFVTVTTVTAAPCELFFTLPAPKTAPVYLYVNDQPFGVQFDTSCSYMLYLGHFEAGEEVRVRMVTADNDRPLQLYNNEKHFYTYDATAAAAALQRLAATELQIEASSRDDHVSGSITTKKEGQTVLFTVPFDRNWRVYLDGRQIETTEAFGALIAFTVDTPGTHHVLLEYHSPQLLLGAVISVLGTALLVGVCLLERKKHFFKQNIT